MKLTKVSAVLAAIAISVTACGGDPTESGGSDSDTITIGSAAFAENEIIAEIYAQALEAEDVKVERKFQIGARETYVPALESGEVNLVPDYTGNLLQFVDAEATASSKEDVEAALAKSLPEGLETLDVAEAENKDSLNVTPEFAEQNDVASIADLADVDGLRLAGNPEFAERPFGLPGMERIYDVTDVDFTAINDGGGPSTVKALLDGDVDVADIFSTTPAIVDNDLVTLEDPKNMFAAQNVVPLITEDKASGKVTDVLNAVSAELTTQDLLDLNGKNQGAEKASPATLAEEWLTSKGLI